MPAKVTAGVGKFRTIKLDSKRYFEGSMHLISLQVDHLVYSVKYSLE